MKQYGIREAKARLSEIVRATVGGQSIILTDNRKPVAMITPLPSDLIDAQVPLQRLEDMKPLSRAMEFRHELFGAPYPFELDF